MNGAKGAYSSKFKAMEKEQIEDLRRMMNESELNARNQRLHKETNRRCRELAQRRKQMAQKEERRRELILSRRRQEIRLATEKFQRGNRGYSPPPSDSGVSNDQRISARPPYLPRRQKRGAGTSLKSEYERALSPTSLEEALKAVRGDLRPHSAFPLFGSGPLTRHNSMQSVVSAPPDCSPAPLGSEGKGADYNQVGRAATEGTAYSQMRSESLQNVANGRSLFEQTILEQKQELGVDCQSLLHVPPTGNLPANQQPTSQRQTVGGQSSAGGMYTKDSQSQQGLGEQPQKGVATACQSNNQVTPTNQSNANRRLGKLGSHNSGQNSNTKAEVKYLNLGQGEGHLQHLGQGHDNLLGEGHERDTSHEPSARDSLEISERSEAKTGVDHKNQQYGINNLQERVDARPPLPDHNSASGRDGPLAEIKTTAGVTRNWSAVQSTYQYVQASSRPGGLGSNLVGGGRMSNDLGSHSNLPYSFEPHNGNFDQTAAAFISTGPSNSEPLTTAGKSKPDDWFTKLSASPNVGISGISKGGVNISEASTSSATIGLESHAVCRRDSGANQGIGKVLLQSGGAGSTVGSGVPLPSSGTAAAAVATTAVTTAAVTAAGIATAGTVAVTAAAAAVTRDVTAAAAVSGNVTAGELRDSLDKDFSGVNTATNAENTSMAVLPIRLESPALNSPKSDENGLVSGNRVVGSRGWQSTAFYLHQGGNGARSQSGANVAIVSPSVKTTSAVSDQRGDSGTAMAENSETGGLAKSNGNTSTTRQEFRIDNLNANFNKNSAYVEQQSAVVGYLFADGMNRDTVVNIAGNNSAGKMSIAGGDLGVEKNFLSQTNLPSSARGKDGRMREGQGEMEEMSERLKEVSKQDIQGDEEQNVAVSAWQDVIMQESKLKQRPPDNRTNSRSGSRSEVGDPLTTAAGLPDDVFIDDSSSVSSTSHVDDSNMAAALGRHMVPRGVGEGQELKGILKRRPASSSVVPSSLMGARLGPGAGVYGRSVSASGNIRDSLDVNKNLIKNKLNEEEEAGRKKSVRFAEILCSEEPTDESRPSNIWSFQQQQQKQGRGPFLQPHPPSGPPSGRAAAGLGVGSAPSRATGIVPSDTNINSKNPSSTRSGDVADGNTVNRLTNHRPELKLDRTPTDDEINSLWEQVREGLDRTPSFASDTSNATPTSQSEHTKYNSRLSVNGLLQNSAPSLAGGNGGVESYNQVTNHNTRTLISEKTTNGSVVQNGLQSHVNNGFVARDQRPLPGDQSESRTVYSRNPLGTLQQVTMKPNIGGNTFSSMGTGGRKMGQNGLGGTNEGQVVAPSAPGLLNSGYGGGADGGGGRGGLKLASKVASTYGNNYMGTSLPARQKKITAEMLQRYGRINGTAPDVHQNGAPVGRVPVQEQQLAGGRVTDYQQQGSRVLGYIQQQGARISEYQQQQLGGGKLPVYQQHQQPGGGRVSDYQQQQQSSRVTDYQQGQGNRVTSYLSENNGKNYTDMLRSGGNGSTKGGGQLYNGPPGMNVIRGDHTQQGRVLEGGQPSRQLYRPLSSTYVPMTVRLNRLEKERPISAAVNNYTNTTESLAAFVAAENLVRQSSVTESTVERAMRLAELRQQTLNQRTANQTPGAQPGVTALSLEENRLLQSLEKLNDQLKIHENNAGRSGPVNNTGPQSPQSYSNGGFRGHPPLTGTRVGGVRRPIGADTGYTTPTQRLLTADRLTGNLTTPQRMLSADRLQGNVATPAVNGQNMGRNGNLDLKYPGSGGNGTVWYPNNQYNRGMRY